VAGRSVEEDTTNCAPVMFAHQRNIVNNMCAKKQNSPQRIFSEIRSQAQFYNIANKLLRRRKTVTQVSVRDPQLFTLYVTALASLLKHHGMAY